MSMKKTLIEMLLQNSWKGIAGNPQEKVNNMIWFTYKMWHRKYRHTAQYKSSSIMLLLTEIYG